MSPAIGNAGSVSAQFVADSLESSAGTGQVSSQVVKGSFSAVSMHGVAAILAHTGVQSCFSRVSGRSSSCDTSTAVGQATCNPTVTVLTVNSTSCWRVSAQPTVSWKQFRRHRHGYSHDHYRRHAIRARQHQRIRLCRRGPRRRKRQGRAGDMEVQRKVTDVFDETVTRSMVTDSLS